MNRKKRTFTGRLWRLLLIKLPACFLIFTILRVTALKWIPVWWTPLMAVRSIEYRNDKLRHTQDVALAIAWKVVKDADGDDNDSAIEESVNIAGRLLQGFARRALNIVSRVCVR